MVKSSKPCPVCGTLGGGTHTTCNLEAVNADLLAALEAAVEQVDQPHHDCAPYCWAQLARAAIARARGEQP